MGLPEDIALLEQNLHDLVIRYEQYFCGIEKREPLQLLDTVERLARRYQNIGIPNSMLKFKYNSLMATLSVHRQKWTRINRLIEEGKYTRDRFKMSLHQRQDEDRRVTRKQPDPTVERIFQEYLAACASCDLPVKSLSRDKIATAIERQKPAIMEKYHCRDIEFAVIIEGGKPRLKARPVKS